MAEMLDDIGYEALNEGPGPKKSSLADKDRVRLDSIVQSMIKNKESDKTIQSVVDDFKSKYGQPQTTTPSSSEQPSFSIQLSEPKMSAPIGPKTKEFLFDKPYDELAVVKELGPKAREAHANIKSEMLGNDKLYETKVREYRRDNYTLDKLKNDYKSQGIILAPQDEQKILKAEKQKRFDMPVTAQDISDAKTGTILNEAGTRKFIKDLNNPAVQKSLYTVDKFNELSRDPNAQNRLPKVKEVANKIGKGELIYDTEKKMAVKPIGLIGSIIEGTVNKFKGEEEYKFYKNSPDQAIIMELENERNNPDMDEPVKVPKGKASEFLKNVSEMPLSPIIAGAVGSIGGSFIGNPEIGPVAATALGAYENRKMQYRGTFKKVYNELRDQGKSELEAIQEARKQAENAQEIGTVVGAAQGYLGAKIGEMPIKGTSFSAPYQQAIGTFLKQNSKEFGKMALEGAAQGGIAAGGELWKNILARQVGIKRNLDEGAADQFWGNMYMSLGIGAAIKAGKGLTKTNYRTILHGLSKLPEEQINNSLQEKVSNGEITQQAADETTARINEYKQKDSQIPENVTEEARFKIQDNIDELNELEAQKESTHKSLQEPIKEKIHKLEEENLALSKEVEKPAKVESGLSKSKEKEAIETAHEFVAEGILPEIYNESVKKDPIGFWKTIAQQAQNRDENWKQLSQPIDEQSVRDQFGDTVVDYAKELFPAPEQSTSSISVIRPGEINRPEVTAIGAGKVPEEKVGHVEISEHGEDTKTAAGEENGIKSSKLSEKGQQEAEELGQYLKDSGKKKIITSEIERAQETGRVASEVSGLPIEYNKVLNTWDIGDYDGKPEGSFVEEAWINKPNEAPKNGESFNDFTNRMEQAYQYVKTLPEDNHVISHSKVMRALSALEKTNGKWTEETTRDFLNNKELTNAQNVRRDQGQLPESGEIRGASQEVGGNDIQQIPPEPSIGGEAEQQAGGEESKASGTQKEVGGGGEGIPPNMFDLPFTPEEGDVNRLAHADTEQLYREMGMNERIPRATKNDIQLEQEADNLIHNGYDFNEKADQILNGESKSFTDAEQVAFAKMVGALKAKLNNMPIDDPAFDAIQRQIEKLSRASDIVGSEEGAAFRARRMFVLNDETLSDFMQRAKQANKDAPLTEQQKKEVKEKWDEFDAAKKDYDKNVDRQKSKELNKKAEENVKKTASTTKRVKKTAEERAAYRKSQIEAARAALDKLKKGGGPMYAVPIPGLPQLIAIAPHVKNIMVDLVEQGVTEFGAVVKKLHEEFKDVLDGLTEQHIREILAGEYNEKKAKRSELMGQVYNIKKQAELINKLERLRAGIEPKSEKALRKRNQEIEALKKQIKDFEKSSGATDAQKLESLKSRYKNLAEEYERRIREGDFEQGEDTPPIVLDKETQESKDRYIEAKKNWNLGIEKQEYENRGVVTKAADLGLGILELKRAVGTAYDFSVPFRQALPVTINPLHWKATARAFREMFSQWYSGKSLDRWWFDLETSSDYKEMLEDGLPVHSPNELRISKREEEFRTRLAEMIPGVKMSNRAASGYLNSMRVDMYRKMRRIMESRGITRRNNPEAYKELGKYIGNLTGSGKLLSALEGKPSKLLGATFFGARLMAAKFNLLNPYYYTKIPKEFRKAALIDLGLRVGMYTTIGSLMNAAGFSVSLHPDDPDFLKIKHGKTTYDITGGEAIYVRTFLRILEAAKDRITGEEKSSLKTAEKAAASTTAFFRNKLAPLPSYGLDAFMGKTSWGAKFDPYDIVRVYPMWIDDIVEDWKQDKAGSILTAGIPSIFGIGVMTKESKKGGGSGGGAGATGHYRQTKSKTTKHK